MTRQIFIVSAHIVDANGAFNALSGYPKTFDSRSYDNNIDRALKRAKGEFAECIGAMCKRDDRQLQSVVLTDSTGFQIDRWSDGAIADVPETEE